MNRITRYTIKSFKHNGHLRRMWLENWRVPDEALPDGWAARFSAVLINDQTRIVEADGQEWVSRVPSVVFFLPGCWYNIVSLLGEYGIRYYCNIASPAYVAEGVITYIDYDLDVIVGTDGQVQLVDEDEFERHKRMYHYDADVERKVREGVDGLMRRIRVRDLPFSDAGVRSVYEWWKLHHSGG